MKISQEPKSEHCRFVVWFCQDEEGQDPMPPAVHKQFRFFVRAQIAKVESQEFETGWLEDGGTTYILYLLIGMGVFPTNSKAQSSSRAL